AAHGDGGNRGEGPLPRVGAVGIAPSPDLLRAQGRSQVDLAPQAGRGGAIGSRATRPEGSPLRAQAALPCASGTSIFAQNERQDGGQNPPSVLPTTMENEPCWRAKTVSWRRRGAGGGRGAGAPPRPRGRAG